jgi:Carbohydrate binding module (family 6)/PLD-like domain
MAQPRRLILFISLLSFAAPLTASAQEMLCDTQFQDCRAPLINLIRTETRGIDVAFWYMADLELANEVVKAFQRGVPVRVLMDQRANSSKPLNATILSTLKNAGIPMREKYNTVEDILHFKMMLFDGQNMVEFSKANYSPEEFIPIQPDVNYSDEAIFYTNDTTLTNSFRRRFDDRWIDTTVFRNYANVSGTLTRRYSGVSIDPSMNFPPTQDFLARTISRLNAETQKIDAIVYRDTEHTPADAMIAAVARNVSVRLISDPDEYRNSARLWDAVHMDRMYMGGVQMKMRQHAGITHEALVVMYGLGEVIFGSSNWTTTSAIYQDEHNYFYNPSLNKPWFFQWFTNQFEGKWNDTVNYVPFVPLPPDPPKDANGNFGYYAPGNGSAGQGTSVTLTWDGGNWSHFYDIYFGTSSNPPLIASNQQLGSPNTGQLETYTVNNLQQGTTYYWKIVDKTWAYKTAPGPVWSFTTAGSGGGGGGGGSTPFTGTPVPVPGTFQAEDFDNGGQSVAYYDTTSGNKGGAYRTNVDVDIATTADTGGGFYVGWTKASEYLKYTINVTTAGTYPVVARVAALGAGGKFHVEVDGVDKTGQISVPNTGSWDVYQDVSTAGIAFTAGQHVIRVVFDAQGSGGGTGNFNWFRIGSGGTPPPPPPPGNTPYTGTPVALPGIVQAENFDNGGEGVAYHDTTSGNSGGATYRSPTDVDIGPTPDTGNAGYYVGWARVGEWLKYTVNVTQSRNYTLSIRMANAGSGATFRIEVDGVDKTGAIASPNTGGWDIYQTISLSGISLSQGTHVLRVLMLTPNSQNNSVGNFGYFSFQ